MAHYKYQVRLNMDSNIAADAVVNTWHVDALTVPNGWEDARDALIAFYNLIDSNLSAALSATGHTITTYRMADPEPRAPIDEASLGTLSPGATAAVPELALCLSFQGEQISGTPQRRRRGRVFIGPLKNMVVSSTDPRVDGQPLLDLADAAEGLLTAAALDGSWTWCVYSPTDDELVPVANGWIDDAFDIQRRRGIAASQRVLFE